MKKLSGCLLFVILCLVSAKENAFAQTKEKDVIYRFKYFLIHAKDTMKIGFIIKKKSSERESEDEDILYEDNKYLILGNKDKLGYDARFGVYRKYRLSYRFSGFKVKVYKGRLAPPDFKSNPEAFTFRTQIKSQCKADGINFAGHFTIAHWGCGSECEDIAVIDRINGKIYYSNLFKAPFDPFYYLFKCRPDSKMIIMNYWLLKGPYKGYIFASDIWPVEIGVWNSSELNFIAKSPLKYDHNLQNN